MEVGEFFKVLDLFNMIELAPKRGGVIYRVCRRYKRYEKINKKPLSYQFSDKRGGFCFHQFPLKRPNKLLEHVSTLFVICKLSPARTCGGKEDRISWICFFGTDGYRFF